MPKKVTSGHVESVCAITDPFCDSSLAKPWPDETGIKTLCGRSRATIVWASGATQVNGYVMVNPAYLFGTFTNTSATTTVTTASTYSAYVTPGGFSGNINLVRIVSAGCIIRATVSASNAQGYVVLNDSATPLGLSSSMTVGDFGYGSSLSKAIYPGMELTWTSRPVGNGARQFTPPNANNNNFGPGNQSEWSTMILSIVGAPASASCITVEYFINYEATLLQDNSLANVLPPRPKASPILTKTATNTMSSTSPVQEGGAQTLGKVIAGAAAKHIAATFDPMDFLEGAMGFLGI